MKQGKHNPPAVEENPVNPVESILSLCINNDEFICEAFAEWKIP